MKPGAIQQISDPIEAGRIGSADRATRASHRAPTGLDHSAGIDLREVAALFVEAGGCYYDLPNVDPWDRHRDARLYDGPYPVVAHPPCQKWGAMAAVNFARWGGDHNRPGNDSGCFASALRSVQTYGGVLEHPAKSRAWQRFSLAKPKPGRWTECPSGGWVCEVWQSAYGHRANKATWLYVFGITDLPAVDWSRPIGTHQIGFHDQRGKSRNKPTLRRAEASATPVPFRDLLISIAASAKPAIRKAV